MPTPILRPYVRVALPVLIALVFVLPSVAAARAPKAAEIDAAVRDVAGEAATAIEQAEDGLRRADAQVQQRKAEVSAARLRLESARLRLSIVKDELAAIDTDLEAAELANDLAGKQELASRRALLEQRRRWRTELVVEAKRTVTLSQRDLTRSKTELKLREAELDRAKLTAWVDKGATPEVDTALAKASRMVAKHRRTLQRDDRRIAAVQRKVDLATSAAASVKPDKDPEVLLAESEQRRQELTDELEGAKRDLDQERETVSRLSVRLDEERITVETDFEKVAELEDGLAAATTAAETTTGAHQRELAERDAVIAELREQLGADDPARVQELAALAGEIEALEEERNRATREIIVRQTAIGELAAANGALEAQLAAADQASSQAEATVEERLRQAAEHHQQELSTLGETADAIAAERDALAQEIAALKGDDPAAESRARQVELLRERLRGAQDTARERIEALEGQLGTATAERDQANARLAASVDEADTLAADAARLRADVETRTGRVTELEAQLAGITADYTSRIDVLVQRAESFDDEGEAAVAALEEELTTTRQRLADAEQAKGTADAELEANAQQIAELQEQARRAAARADQAEDGVATGKTEHAAELTSLRATQADELSAQRVRADQAEAQLAEVSGEATTLAGRLEEAEAELASAKTALDATEGAANSLVDDLQARYDDIKEERDTLTVQLQEQRELAALEVETLRSQVTELTAGRDEATARVADREARVAELTEALSAGEAERRESQAGLRAELRTTRDERDRQRASLTELEAVLRETKRRLARIEGENTALWTRIDDTIEWNDKQGG
jgi:chromosome segregation ATPase